MPQQRPDERFCNALWGIAIALLLILGVAQLDEHRRFRRDVAAVLAANQQRAEGEIKRLEVELASSQAYLDALRAYAREEQLFRQREEALRNSSKRYSVIESGAAPLAATTQAATMTPTTATAATEGRDDEEVTLVRPQRPQPPLAAPRAFATPLPTPRFEDYQLVSRIRRGVSMSAFVACAALPFAWLLGGAGFAQRHRRAVAEAMLVLALLGTGGMLLGWGYWRNWNILAPDNNAAGWGLVLIPVAMIAVLIASRRDSRDVRDARDAAAT